MMQVAMTLTPQICKLAGELEIPNSYINENPYFVGHGASVGKRLSTDFRMKALKMLGDDKELGRGLSPKVFQEDYCSPLLKAEKWLQQLKKQFGTHLKQYYWGTNALWSRSYCLLSVGGATIEVIRKYIESQDRPA